MQAYQKDFIAFALRYQALKFGEFTLKSGRKSPYFFNMAAFQTGQALAALGGCYAQAIQSMNIPFDVLFGPAYKGIPLAVSTAIAFAQLLQQDVAYAFNRKEAKDHGEGGVIVGTKLTGKVLIIDDVITAGTAVRESLQIIDREGAKPAGVIVALDRQERGQNAQSAIQEIQETFHIPVFSIISLANLIEFLADDATLNSYLPQVLAYRDKYGV